MNGFLEKVTSINNVINGAVWGLPGLILLIGTGVLLTFGTKFFQISRLGHWWKKTIASVFKKDNNTTQNTDKKTISQFQALCAALAATIGTGNIAGVAAAIRARTGESPDVKTLQTALVSKGVLLRPELFDTRMSADIN